VVVVVTTILKTWLGQKVKVIFNDGAGQCKTVDGLFQNMDESGVQIRRDDTTEAYILNERIVRVERI
jgi:hypothetical protein